jgi:hypothetical protein
VCVVLGFELIQGLKLARPELYHPFIFLETGSHYVAQAGLELVFFLPQCPKCLDYTYAPPCMSLVIFFFLAVWELNLELCT